MIALDTVSSSEFEACLHEIFSLVATDGMFPLQLAQVQPLGGGSIEAKRKPFSITLRAAHAIRLPQGIYRVENDKLGSLELFLVQTSPTDLEAVFN